MADPIPMTPEEKRLWATIERLDGRIIKAGELAISLFFRRSGVRSDPDSSFRMFSNEAVSTALCRLSSSIDMLINRKILSNSCAG